MAQKLRSIMESRLDSPLSSPGCHTSRSHILDDIKNDQELLCDSEEEHVLSLPQVSSTVEHSIHRMSSCNTSRRSSLAPMENLQREVDLALEIFTNENSDEDELLENHYFTSIDKASIRFESEESGSCPGTATTSLATSCDYDLNDCPGTSPTLLSDGGLSLKHRTKSILSLPMSLLPSKPLMTSLGEEDAGCKFDSVVGDKLVSLGITKTQRENRSFKIDFSTIRSEMEPFLASARKCFSS